MRERRKEKNIKHKKSEQEAFYEEPSKVMSIIYTLFFSSSWSSYNNKKKTKEEYEIIKKYEKQFDSKVQIIKEFFLSKIFLEATDSFADSFQLYVPLFLDHTIYIIFCVCLLPLLCSFAPCRRPWFVFWFFLWKSEKRLLFEMTCPQNLQNYQANKFVYNLNQ